ncbi:hypothetical protein G4X40_06725 [Rhodococcus sp. D2-41]|uniref:hypothetical protein n=1 Tax=Speluncibacter jeojiensis TaxID=2710754 RepID=UPI00240EDD5E|nr:hypothetical protein [Rhodococcus sp. D2-41]MDG3009838.1 hypothetical protein [Rhodococcus sp. D2-41]
MKRVVARTAVAVAGAATIALLAQPGLANAKMNQPPQQIPSDAMVLHSLRFDHNLGVASQNSGVPQALNRADLTTPIH